MPLDYCSLVVAIEFSAPVRPASYFERALAQPLANQLSFELAKQLPSLDGLGLAWMAGCFDQAQLLRPGFPVFRALHQLYQAGVRDALAMPQVLTLQALRGAAPVPELSVDEPLLGGTMCFIPLVIIGPSAAISEAREVLEAKLMETGLTDARTALMLNQALGVDAEHARLMTLDDLAALSAVQLEHAGLPIAWELLEVALFSPQRGYDNTDAQGLRLTWLDGAAQIHLQALRGDRAAFISAALRERQVRSLLQAHGLPVELTYPDRLRIESHAERQFWLEWLREGNVSQLLSHLSEELGVAWYDLLDSAGQLLGRAYPLAPGAQAALLARFADTAATLTIAQDG